MTSLTKPLLEYRRSTTILVIKEGLSADMGSPERSWLLRSIELSGLHHTTIPINMHILKVSNTMRRVAIEVQAR